MTITSSKVRESWIEDWENDVMDFQIKVAPRVYTADLVSNAWVLGSESETQVLHT